MCRRVKCWQCAVTSNVFIYSLKYEFLDTRGLKRRRKKLNLIQKVCPCLPIHIGCLDIQS